MSKQLVKKQVENDGQIKTTEKILNLINDSKVQIKERETEIKKN